MSQVLTVPAPAVAATKGTVTLLAETDAVQVISITGAPTSGTFELTWAGFPSLTAARNSTLAAFQALLDATFGAGNTLATGGPLPGTAITVTWQGTLAGETIPLPTIDDTLLAGGTTPHAHVSVTQPGGGDHILVPKNASRVELVIAAQVADAWVSYGTAGAVIDEGYPVRAGGEPHVERHWRGEVHVISTGAAQVSFTELSLAVGDDEGQHPTGADTFVPSGPSDSYYSDAIASAEKDPDATHPGGSSGQPYPPNA